ncbi:MAG: hypothetical protein KAX49_04450 [Halanaerobiales bacterium]|nr:hypothetical protein [Halanaerobiales bacterium]
MDMLLQAKENFKKIIAQNNLIGNNVTISARGLTTEEAIGNPGRNDFPLMTGKEVMIEAEFMGSKGQSFTDHPGNFQGKLKDILELPLDNNYHRALFVAALNAVLRSLNLAEKTVHCKNEEPEMCSKEILKWIEENYKNVKNIGIIGFQPAMIEKLSEGFGPDHVIISDLNEEKIGTIKFGIKIWDGKKNNEKLIKKADFILITGSSIINNTFNELVTYLNKYKKEYRLFGNTISGVATLINLPHICFYGH